MKRRATPLALTSLVFIASLGSPVSGQDQEERQMMGARYSRQTPREHNRDG